MSRLCSPASGDATPSRIPPSAPFIDGPGPGELPPESSPLEQAGTKSPNASATTILENCIMGRTITDRLRVIQLGSVAPPIGSLDPGVSPRRGLATPRRCPSAGLGPYGATRASGSRQ